MLKTTAIMFSMLALVLLGVLAVTEAGGTTPPDNASNSWRARVEAVEARCAALEAKLTVTMRIIKDQGALLDDLCMCVPGDCCVTHSADPPDPGEG